jgi:hypothetical protein
MKSWVIVLVSAAGLGVMAEDAFAQQRSRSHSSSAQQHRHHSSSAQQHRHHSSSGHQHRHHSSHRHHHHGHHHNHWRGSGIVFAPAYWPWYGYAPAPLYAAPPVVVEPAVAPSMNSGYWYFCPDTRAFYPHVMECRSGWQAMVPGSPPPN